MQKVQTTTSISVQDIQKELKRIHQKHHNRSIVKNTLIFLLALVAVSVLLANFWLPVLQVFGTSMEPTLKQGDTVVAMKTNRIKQGDLIAFYFNNRMLVKRVIGLPGDSIDIDKNGQVSVNGKVIKEPYVKEMTKGEINIKLPFEVPQERYFVLGDDRSTSIDSRNSIVGTVAPDQMVGKVVLRIWPFDQFGKINQS